MNLAEQGYVAKLRGQHGRYLELLGLAFDKERAAAELVAAQDALEPTRSILHRSAASLAIECGRLRDAEKLIAAALAGEPPDEIAEELRILFEKTVFQQALHRKGIVLAPVEVHVSITGQAVDYGLTESGVFLDRVQDIERLVFRTAERQQNVPFRERGKPSKLLGGLGLYLTAPQASSFAISFRIGAQLGFHGLDPNQDIMRELLDCLELFNGGHEGGLRERIREEAYYLNFVSLARNVSPDGDDIRAVRFATLDDGHERSILLSRYRREIPAALLRSGLTQAESEQVMTLEGTLRFADGLKRKDLVGLRDSEGHVHKIIVPPGLLDDIVQPLWDSRVSVTAVIRGKSLHLRDISKTAEP